MEVPKGRVAYEPNTLAPEATRECPMHGFRTQPEVTDGVKLRKRAETFADHYSQARMFFRSMTEPEQNHIASALAFELAHVEFKEIRRKMLGHLANIDTALHDTVAAALGMEGQAEVVTPAITPKDLAPSEALSLVAKDPGTLKGRKAGILLTDGFDTAQLSKILNALKKERAAVALIAPKIGGATGSDGTLQEVDFALSGGPSFFFDTVVLLVSDSGCAELVEEAAAVNWVRDAFGHLKVIGHVAEAQPLLDAASVVNDEGVRPISDNRTLAAYITTARAGRRWEREPALRSIG